MKRILLLPLIFQLSILAVNAQSVGEKATILRTTNVERLLQISEVAAERSQRDKAVADEKARKNGWTIRKEFEDGSIIELVRLDEFGNPVYLKTDNIDAAESISTSRVWSGGGAGLSLSGGGLTAGEWDGGAVLVGHQEFGGRVTQVDGASTLSDHATHVAGTIIASGVDSDAKGMSYQAALDAYDWNDDEAEMATAAANGLLVSNHSYSFIRGWYYDSGESVWKWYGNTSISTSEDYNFGFYDYWSALWDDIAYNAPYYLIVKSAGNDRNDSHTGSHQHGSDPTLYTDSHDGDGDYDCISQKGISKNVLTIGAVEDIPGGYSNVSDVVQTSFSSWGPADDGRIKPDLVANGSGLYSCSSSGTTSYGSKSGTSMSSPSTTGSLLLLQEHYNDLNPGLFMLSSTLKGLVIHTADEAGAADGPDYQNGWGLMNTETAAEVITNDGVTTLILEQTLANGDSIVIPLDALGTEPMIATVCWTDPAGSYPSASLDPTDIMLVNDVDMRITKGATTYSPWKLNGLSPTAAATTGNNDVDNVEQVVISNPSGTGYVLVIKHEGSLSGGSQIVSIILSGVVLGPPQAAFTASPLTVCPGEPVTMNDASNGASSWEWIFSDGTPSSSTSQNPTVTYGSSGLYDVTQIVSNSSGTDTLTHQQLIVVSQGVSAELNLLTDNYGEETTWVLKDDQGLILSSGGPYDDNFSYSEEFCLQDGCYDLVFYDLYGDGICCGFGTGYYNLLNTDSGDTLVSGAAFLFTDSTNFCLYTCSNPTVFSVSSLEYNKATMSWNPISSALEYKVRFTEVGSGSWQYITVSAPDTFKVKAGLVQLTDYEWQVKTVCAGDQSSYGTLQTFTTPALPCDPPSTYSTTGILDERATMNWSDVSTALEYKIRIREVGAGSWTFITELSTSKTKAGLTPGTDYEWQVKVVCDGDQSSYGPLQSFTTYLVSPCPNPSTYSTTLIQGDRATLGWSAVGPATTYKVRFREVGVSSWTNIYVNASSTSKVKTGLTPETDYEWQLRTKCTDVQTVYGPLQTFTTGPDCPKPTGFSVTNILEDRATMNWSTVTDAVEYKVKVRPVGGSWSYLTATAPATQKTKTGLDAATDYQWRVRSVCATSRSPFAAVQAFTTLTAPEARLSNVEDDEISDLRVYPNPTSGELIIELGEEYENGSVVIRNALGQVVHSVQVEDTDQLTVNIPGSAGLYIVEVLTTNGVFDSFRVVKE